MSTIGEYANVLVDDSVSIEVAQHVHFTHVVLGYDETLSAAERARNRQLIVKIDDSSAGPICVLNMTDRPQVNINLSLFEGQSVTFSNPNGGSFNVIGHYLPESDNEDSDDDRRNLEDFSDTDDSEIEDDAEDFVYEKNNNSDSDDEDEEDEDEEDDSNDDDSMYDSEDDDEMVFLDEEDEDDDDDDDEDESDEDRPPRLVEISQEEAVALEREANGKLSGTKHTKMSRTIDGDMEAIEYLQEIGQDELDEIVKTSQKQKQLPGKEQKKVADAQQTQQKQKQAQLQAKSSTTSTTNSAQQSPATANKKAPAAHQASSPAVNNDKKRKEEPVVTNPSATASPAAAESKKQKPTPAKAPESPAANKKTLPGGLVIQDKVIGKGKQAKNGKTVSVKYTGRLTNGKVFDASTGKPFSFRLGEKAVIAGWEQGLQGMGVGGKRTLTIPPALAYGSRGAGKDIPPNSTLIFDIELVNVK